MLVRDSLPRWTASVHYRLPTVTPFKSLPAYLSPTVLNVRWQINLQRMAVNRPSLTPATLINNYTKNDWLHNLSNNEGNILKLILYPSEWLYFSSVAGLQNFWFEVIFVWDWMYMGCWHLSDYNICCVITYPVTQWHRHHTVRLQHMLCNYMSCHAVAPSPHCQITTYAM